jgi:Flp pilus assembly CpaF family ATPase
LTASLPRKALLFHPCWRHVNSTVPPAVAAPCFAIRRPAVAVFALGDCVDAGIMFGAQAELLRATVRDRKNILVAGGTSTGKTTLVNALLARSRRPATAWC